MCESKVFVMDGKKKEKVMDEAVLVEDEGGKLVVIGLMGERKEIPNAKIARVSADKHEVYIKRI